MKRFIVILFLIPSISFGAFTEFYMTSGGSNLNSGSTTDNTSPYTSASGNWVQSTRVFTPTDGQTTSSHVSVGDFVSIYANAGTVSAYIGRVTTVGAGVNGTITIDATANYGAAPSNSTGGITCKRGGAWKGPSTTTSFPFGLAGTIGTLLDTGGDHTRVNVKNDQTYTMTSQLDFSSLGNAVMQGYSSTVGDLGKATFSTNLVTSSNFIVSTNSGQAFIDLIFVCTGTSSTNQLFVYTPSYGVFLRCVFHGARGVGLLYNGSGSGVYAIECEFYDDNKSNTANDGALSTTSGGPIVCVNCYSHDNASGTNAHGYSNFSSGGGIILINSIADTNAGSGVNYSVGTGLVLSINSDYYNNAVDGIHFGNVNQGTFSVLMNNNFVLNAGKAINNTNASQSGILYNNGRGAGTQANGHVDVLGSIYDTGTDINYASNVTPWNAPTTGDFSITLSAAEGVGRSHFEENDGTNTGTVGYPDIGAAQANIGCPYPTPTATATSTPTPTATATATATPTSTPTPVQISYGFAE